MSYAMVAVAAAGVIKHYAVDKPNADKQRTLAAKTQEFSPWTGLQAGPTSNPSAVDAGLTGAASGAALGQNISKTNAQNALLKAQADKLNNTAPGGDPGAQGDAIAGMKFGNANPYGDLPALDPSLVSG